MKKYSGNEEGSTRSEIGFEEELALSSNTGTIKYIYFCILFSLASNLLLLVSPLYMIQVYDRVLSSGSFSTLINVTFIAVFLIGIYTFAEAGRRHAMAAYARRTIDTSFVRLSHWLLSRQRFAAQESEADAPTIQDVARVQGALYSGLVLPFFDLPFTPLFLMLMFMLHPLIGLLGLAGALLLTVTAILSERLTSDRYLEDQQTEAGVQRYMNSLQNSVSSVISMGIRSRALKDWSELKSHSLNGSLNTSFVAGFLNSFAKSLRQGLQILVLGAGAYLVLNGEMSGGAIVAGSIVMGRALAPIDQIVSGWKQFVLVFGSWRRLRHFGKKFPEFLSEEAFAVSDINATLSCSRVTIIPPGGNQPILEPFDLDLKKGQLAVLMGPSGSGKSSFLQTVSGAWPLVHGKVVLGNRDISFWQDEDRGRFVGYLAQDIDLLPGTVASNISRVWEYDESEVEVVCKQLGFHEFFMTFPEGYSTKTGPMGHKFSAGQRQAVGLAQACSPRSRILLLDEPTSNLDSGLANALLKALADFRDSGRLIVVATHDRRFLPLANRLFSTQGRRISELAQPERGSPVRVNPGIPNQARHHES